MNTTDSDSRAKYDYRPIAILAVIVAVAAIIYAIGLAGAQAPQRLDPVAGAALQPVPVTDEAPPRQLVDFGVENGPNTVIGLPATARVTFLIDQPNVVSMQLADASPNAIETAVRNSAATAGFDLIGENNSGSSAFTFSGQFNGQTWFGSVTAADANTVALTLRNDVVVTPQ